MDHYKCDQITIQNVTGSLKKVTQSIDIFYSFSTFSLFPFLSLFWTNYSETFFKTL